MHIASFSSKLFAWIWGSAVKSKPSRLSPVSRDLCRPFPPLHHLVMTAWARCQDLNLDSAVKVKKSDRKCASTASQRDILPAVCEHLKLHQGVIGAVRGAETAALFTSIITPVLTLDHQRLFSPHWNQCFLIFSPGCSNKSNTFMWIYPAPTAVKTSTSVPDSAEAMFCLITVIQCQENTIAALLFYNNPYFTIIRLIVLAQAKTTNACAGLLFLATVAT